MMLYPFLRLATGISFKVEGKEYLTATRPCIFIANHQDSMDVVAFTAIASPGITAVGKKELAKMPIFGSWFKRACFPLNRQNHEKAIETMNQVAETLKKDKMALIIMPEGTRSRLPTPDMLPFKKGAFRTAIDNGIPIVPFVIQVVSFSLATNACSIRIVLTREPSDGPGDN